MSKEIQIFAFKSDLVLFRKALCWPKPNEVSQQKNVSNPIGSKASGAAKNHSTENKCVRGTKIRAYVNKRSFSKKNGDLECHPEVVLDRVIAAISDRYSSWFTYIRRQTHGRRDLQKIRPMDRRQPTVWTNTVLITACYKSHWCWMEVWYNFVPEW